MILEDGTGIENANALISLAKFKSLADDRSVDITAYTDSQIEGSIVVASVDFMNTYYTIKGDSITDDQGMQLPTDQVDINSSIENACYQATLLNLKSRLFVDPLEFEVMGQLTSSRKKLDVLETEKEYKEGSNYTNKYPTTSIDNLMRPYVTGGVGGNMSRVKVC